MQFASMFVETAEIKEYCQEFLLEVLDTEKCFAIWQSAKKFCLTSLDDRCAGFMATNLGDLAEVDEISKLSRSEVMEILDYCREVIKPFWHYVVMTEFSIFTSCSTESKETDRLFQIQTLLCVKRLVIPWNNTFTQKSKKYALSSSSR